MKRQYSIGDKFIWPSTLPDSNSYWELIKGGWVSKKSNGERYFPDTQPKLFIWYKAQEEQERKGDCYYQPIDNSNIKKVLRLWTSRADAIV